MSFRVASITAGSGLAALAGLLALNPQAAAQSAAAGPTSAVLAAGEQVFDARCKGCHDPAIERAPGRAELATRDVPDIVTALTSGVMAPMAGGLSQGDKQAVALWLVKGGEAQGPKPPVAAAALKGDQPGPPADTRARARATPPPIGQDRLCEGAPPAIAAGAADWPSVNADAASSRFQRRPGLTTADLPRLKLKWAYTMTGGGQPSVVGDWLFMANRNGMFYALDAKSGCVRWVNKGVTSRTTPVVVRTPASPSGWMTLVGQNTRVVRAFDAQTGAEIWKSEVLEPLAVAGITGALVVSGEQVFVPMTSGEEGAAIQKTYSCCVFRGSLVALDLKTGRKSWQTPMITEPLHPIRKTVDGTQMQGPAGAAIWSAPTTDAKRGLVYVVTGDSYTEADTRGADAIVALEMKTGKVRWSRQVTTGDNYVMACEPALRSGNCPTPRGPDHDFGASPVLVSLKGGGQVLVAGQKSGEVYGLAPDTGKLLWKTRVGSGSALGGVEWGIGADDRYVFVPIADTGQLFNDVTRAAGEPVVTEVGGGPARSGLYALDPATGRIAWSAPAPVAPCHYAGDRSRDYAKGVCIRAQSAAPAIIPGAVFSGTLDGWFRAYDARTGKVVWAFSTTGQTYDTVNGVKGQPGGGIDGMGPAVAGGMVYTMSGFNGAARTGGNGNNVLLAFSVDGR